MLLNHKKGFKGMALPVLLISAGFGLRYLLNRKSDDEIEQLGQIYEINGKNLHILHQHKNEIYIVFIHGFGGQMIQFKAQIDYLGRFFSIFAIDFVGHGKSSPGKGLDYSIESITDDICTALKCFNIQTKNIILVTHSLGTLIGAKISQMIAINGIVLIAPKAKFNRKQVEGMKKIAKIPGIVFEILRYLDRFGGIRSASVNRLLSNSASDEAKNFQLLLNKSTKSQVVRGMLLAAEENDLSQFKCNTKHILIVSLC
jgi:pimeloyl-ACP methyl ester carboxylesterase